MKSRSVDPGRPSLPTMFICMGAALASLATSQEPIGGFENEWRFPRVDAVWSLDAVPTAANIELQIQSKADSLRTFGENDVVYLQLRYEGIPLDLAKSMTWRLENPQMPARPLFGSFDGFRRIRSSGLQNEAGASTDQPPDSDVLVNADVFIGDLCPRGGQALFAERCLPCALEDDCTLILHLESCLGDDPDVLDQAVLSFRISNPSDSGFLFDPSDWLTPSVMPSETNDCRTRERDRIREADPAADEMSNENDGASADTEPRSDDLGPEVPEEDEDILDGQGEEAESENATPGGSDSLSEMAGASEETQDEQAMGGSSSDGGELTHDEPGHSGGTDDQNEANAPDTGGMPDEDDPGGLESPEGGQPGDSAGITTENGSGGGAVEGPSAGSAGGTDEG